MALSDKRILEEMGAGNIVISPFNQEVNLNTSSYDVRLGQYFYRQQQARGYRHIYDPWNQEDVIAVWGDVQQAKLASEELPASQLDRGGIAASDRVIVVRPGETILGHTEEFIGGRNHITTMMKARSSMGRNSIEVCKCAGWGDVGYINRWTMEITNNSSLYAIPLIVGARVAQIVFIETGPILGADYSKQGKYQNTDDLEELQRNWSPESMLPRLSRDRGNL